MSRIFLVGLALLCCVTQSDADWVFVCENSKGVKSYYNDKCLNGYEQKRLIHGWFLVLDKVAYPRVWVKHVFPEPQSKEQYTVLAVQMGFHPTEANVREFHYQAFDSQGKMLKDFEAPFDSWFYWSKAEDKSTDWRLWKVCSKLGSFEDEP